VGPVGRVVTAARGLEPVLPEQPPPLYLAAGPVVDHEPLVVLTRRLVVVAHVREQDPVLVEAVGVVRIRELREPVGPEDLGGPWIELEQRVPFPRVAVTNRVPESSGSTS
jgi:hypothetical protein